jgi:hypothetical protein
MKHTLTWKDGFSVTIVNGKAEGYRDVPCGNGNDTKGKAYRMKVGDCLERFFVPELKVTFVIDSSD